MSYSGQMNGSSWTVELETKCENLLQAITDAYDFYLKWYAFSYGQSDTQLATLLSLTQAQVDDMTAAINDFNDLQNAITNIAVGARDRRTDFVKFI